MFALGPQCVSQTDIGRGPRPYLDTIATIFLVRASMIKT